MTRLSIQVCSLTPLLKYNMKSELYATTSPSGTVPRVTFLFSNHSLYRHIYIVPDIHVCSQSSEGDGGSLYFPRELKKTCIYERLTLGVFVYHVCGSSSVTFNDEIFLDDTCSVSKVILNVIDLFW